MIHNTLKISVLGSKISMSPNMPIECEGNSSKQYPYPSIKINYLCISVSDQVIVYNMREASVYDYKAKRLNIFFTINHSRYVLCMLVTQRNYVVKLIFLHSKSMYLKKRF